jgi:hypothetical protein
MFPLVGLCLAGLLWIMALKRKEHRAVKARGDPPLPFDI